MVSSQAGAFSSQGLRLLCFYSLHFVTTDLNIQPVESREDLL